MGKKIRNPLIKRIPKELKGDWRKYLVVSLFLILVIGFVSGLFVANESMMASLDGSALKYKLEDGHFELKSPADEALISAISTGEKADIKAFYISEAKTELDERFEDEFKKEFTEKFDSEFNAEFDKEFSSQIERGMALQGLDKASISAMLPEAFSRAKQSEAYKTAYNKAYEEAYKKAYDEARQRAYDEAWNRILTEIDEKYAEAEEKYKLDDPDFQSVPVSVYENFYRNENEDNNNDGVTDGTVRVFKRTENINLASVLEGRLPEADNEIAIDRMHADNVGVKVGDTITAGGERWEVVGLIAYANYSTLHEKNTDFIFDAIKFNVAMVTSGGFERLNSPVHFNYAWEYENKPADEKAEKELADSFLPALLTQVLVRDNELKDFLPAYANQAIHFAAGDMGSDMSMGSVLLNILIIIIAFIFAVTISNTITNEAKAIGTLRASGYTKGELIGHYLATPVIVTIISAAIGNLLGYTVFKNVVVSMYYNSYSLPAYETLWNPDAFIRTTVIPVVLMFVVNLCIISVKMRHTPLEFLRGDLKKNRRKKAVKLPRWQFFSRFRLRVVFQNIPNYLILFFGVFFISVMLAIAVGMPNTLNYYKENASEMMFSNYQYVLKSYENEDGSRVVTENQYAEPFCMKTLQRKSDAIDEEISVYGVADNSKYVNIEGFQNLAEGEAYISNSFAEKYDVSIGETVTLDEKYENKQYIFKVAGFYEKSLGLSVFMPAESFRTSFGLKPNEISGYLSDTQITDIGADSIATVITERDITKMCDQLDHSMGAYMKYFQVLCILLSAVMIYLLTKIIIEKNEKAISMVKILGYQNMEIVSLYLFSTAIILLIADAVSVFLGSLVMNEVWKAMMSDYSGWFTFRISADGYLKMFLFVLIGYLIVVGFDFRRIKKIPMDEALKNAE